MKCNECRELLVAYLDKELEENINQAVKQHLKECEECRIELHSFQILNEELKKRGPITTDVSLVDPVMNRIKVLENPDKSQDVERNTFMSKLIKWRWTMGIGAFAGMAVLIMIAVLSGTHTISAAEVFIKGAEAMGQLNSIHLKGKLRTSTDDNFSYINPNLEFVDIELWKEFKPAPRWKIDKPGRIAAMDGDSTILFIKPDYAYKIPHATRSAFDTDWLHQIANVSQSLTSELKSIEKNGWKNSVEHQQNNEGKNQTIVTIEANSGYKDDDYLKNTFFCTADTRRVYIFDDTTGLLTSAKIYLAGNQEAKLLFELTQIDYNPALASDVFSLDLPTDVTFDQSDIILPDNKKYEAMSAEEAAKAFFDACAREDWEEVNKFCTVTKTLKEYLGGVKIISLKEHFTSAVSLINGAQFVPYEIELKDGQIKKHNIAFKRHPETNRWFVDGGI